MSKSKSVMLVLGASHTYQKKRYVKGVSTEVSEDTYKHLMGIKIRGASRFAEPTRKSIIRKPEYNEHYIKIPVFRSKVDLANYAVDNHGYKFEEDFKDLKMKDMLSTLEEHLNPSEVAAPEHTVEV